VRGQHEFQVSPADGESVPSKSANSGADSTIQQAWYTLKTGGFNTIHFKVDLNVRRRTHSQPLHLGESKQHESDSSYGQRIEQLGSGVSNDGDLAPT
jgi:hypothetical protein